MLFQDVVILLPVSNFFKILSIRLKVHCILLLLVSRLVTAYSKIDIEVLSKFTLKSDVVVGKVSLDINELLHTYNGQCKCYQVHPTS